MVLASSSYAFRLSVLMALFAIALAGYPVLNAEAAEPVPSANQEAAGDDGPRERPDLDSAMVTARLSGERIEDLSQRSETTQVFANPDGSWTSEAATGPVRVQDPNSGDWADIDTTLMEVDGGFAPTAAIGDLVLSAGGDNTFAAMDVEGRDLAWRWPTTLPEPSIEGSVATYADVVDNGDLVVTATASGFRHDIVLREAPENPVSFAVPVVTGGEPKVREDSDDGTLAIQMGDGTELVTAPQPVMYDSSTDEQGDPAEILPVETAVTQTVAGSVIKLAPAQDFLANPATEYPVTVDPLWEARPSGDAYVSSRTPDTSYGDTDDLRVGTPNAGTHKARSFIRFNPAGEPWIDPDLDATVISAQLTLNNFETYTCSGGAVNVSRLTSAFYAQSMTWNSGQPSATADGRATSNVARGMSGCAAADVTWNVTAMVQAWAAGAEPHGFQVKGVDETATNTWRRYRSANYATDKPRLSVTYNLPPAAPQGLHLVNAEVCEPDCAPLVATTTSSTPTLGAASYDVDGDAVRTDFEIFVGEGATLQVLARGSGANAPGQYARWGSPVLPEGEYSARARTWDGKAHGPWSASMDLVVNAQDDGTDMKTPNPDPDVLVSATTSAVRHSTFTPPVSIQYSLAQSGNSVTLSAGGTVLGTYRPYAVDGAQALLPTSISLDAQSRLSVATTTTSSSTSYPVTVMASFTASDPTAGMVQQLYPGPEFLDEDVADDMSLFSVSSATSGSEMVTAVDDAEAAFLEELQQEPEVSVQTIPGGGGLPAYVKVPKGSIKERHYYYDPGLRNPRRTPWKRAWHDYCTMGQDGWRSREVSWKGPCARHDLCIEFKLAGHRADCDTWFKRDMYINCGHKFRSSSQSDARNNAACRKQANTYFAVVRRTTVKKGWNTPSRPSSYPRVSGGQY